MCGAEPTIEKPTAPATERAEGGTGQSQNVVDCAGSVSDIVWCKAALAEVDATAEVEAAQRFNFNLI